MGQEKKRFILSIGVVICVMCGGGAHVVAQGVGVVDWSDFAFSLTLTVGDTTDSWGFTSIEDLFDATLPSDWRNLDVGYTDDSAAVAVLNVRGLTAMASFDAFSNTLVFDIDSLGIHEEFGDFATRDENQEDFEDWIESNGDGILTQMLQKLVETTPNDPVAGNPNSHMARLARASFAQGTDVGINVGSTSVRSASEAQQNQFRIAALNYGSFDAGSLTQDTIVLPISYTKYMSDPRRQLKIDVPIMWMDTSGSDSYALSIGVGYRLPVTNDWSLTPGIRVGAAGSIDLGAAAISYSGSLTSNVNLYSGESLKWSIGNMIGYMATNEIDAGDYEVDYDLQNPMTKNGIALEGPLGGSMFGEPATWKVSVANTYIFGDDWYIDNFNDAAISFGTRKRGGTDKWTDLRLGVTYTWTNVDDFEGWAVNFGYAF